MSIEQRIEVITLDALLPKVTGLRKEGFRLVQIGATRLPETLELTYSFDLDGRLFSLRLEVPAPSPRVPSISSIYFASVLYENEIHDLFDLQVDGLALDFKGNFYKTSVKHAFANPPAPVVKPAATPAAPAAPATTTPTA